MLRSVWVKASANEDTKRTTLAIISLLIVICCFFVFGMILFDQFRQVDLATSTPTLAPLNTLAPTNTATLTLTALSLTQPTASVTPLSLPVSSATNTTIPSIQASVTSGAPNIVCSYNFYNCSSFSTQRQSQSVYDYCKAQGVGDIHKLDGTDNDGKVCESLH